MAEYDWDSKQFRDGWYLRGDKAKKSIPKWLVLGFVLRDLIILIMNAKK